MDYSQILQSSLNDIQKKCLSAYRDILKKIQNKKVTWDDAMIFSKVVGDAMSNVVGAVSPEDLGEYAEEYLSKVYDASTKTVKDVASRVAKVLAQNDGLNIEVPEAPLSDRIENIVKRFKEAESFDEVSFLTGSDVTENITKSQAVDVIKTNAEFQQRLGLKTYVSRTDAHNCCKWCASMVGVYPVDNVPSDFWRVHKNCTCSFEYKRGNTFTKITYSSANGRISKNTQNI